MMIAMATDKGDELWHEAYSAVIDSRDRVDIANTKIFWETFAPLSTVFNFLTDTLRDTRHE